MVGHHQTQGVELIKNHYREEIRNIMLGYQIAPTQPNTHIVLADADFEKVVQHSHWFLDRNDTRPHYRYERYWEVLGYRQALAFMQPKENRTAHVDIGCGAGLFSWAVLDRARQQGMDFNDIDLYGLDHSPAMINLAEVVKERLMQHIAGYPVLRYHHVVDQLLEDLTTYSAGETDYIISLGHVLVQAKAPSDVQNFTRVISHITNLVGDGCRCALVAIDGRNWGHEFTVRWDELLNNLDANGIRPTRLGVPPTVRNGPLSAKFAYLGTQAQ